MNIHDDASEPVDRPRRSRARIAAGVAGLAVVLGAGAYAITDDLTGQSGRVAEPGRLTPRAVPQASAAGVSPEPLVSASSGSASPSSSPSSSSSSSSASPTQSLPADVVASIKAARENMAKHGVKIKRAPAPPAAVAPIVDLQRSTVGSLDKGGIVRLVTARSDLTGQQELAWVAGGITDHGDDKCSQTFKLYNDPEPQEKPNLLVCWRTSEKRSVVAVIVDPAGHPSTATALAALHQKWESMS